MLLATTARRIGEGPLLVCDLTQSWSPAGGGGMSTYVREKRDFVLRRTPHHLLQIVPGENDRITTNGRHVFPEVAADTVRGRPDYRFILHTSKVRAALVERARGLPIAFPGFEPDPAGLARALASSDVYVSAMADETFGIAVLEAQAAGLPVVGVESGAMPARVPPGLGRLGPVDDIDAMAANVRALLAASPAALGRAARDHIERRYSWTATFEKLFGDI